MLNLQQYNQKLSELCRRYDIKTMHVFGSACTEKFNESSDIDFLIAFQDISFERYTDNYFEMHEALEQLFGRKVDLITENALSNPFFMATIDRTKQLIYAA